jgi:hypothetical protein
LNWKDCVIKGNTFSNIQSLSDGRKSEKDNPVLYPAISLKGIVNPTIIQNTISSVQFFPILIDRVTAPTTQATASAGYPDTVSVLSEQNYADMQNNTFKNIEELYRFILIRDTETQAIADAERREIEVK